MNLITYNIQCGGQKRLPYLVGVLRAENPDLVILQEASNPLMVRRLARRLGMRTWGSLAGYSLAFMSRMVVSRVGWHPMPHHDHALLELRLPNLRIFGVHLRPYAFHPSAAQRLTAIDHILNMIQHTQPDTPHLLVGTLNSLAPGDKFSRSEAPSSIQQALQFQGDKVPRGTIDRLLKAEYVDAFRCVNPHEAGFTTSTAQPYARVDFAMLSKSLADQLVGCAVVSHAERVLKASDHFPLKVALK